MKRTACGALAGLLLAGPAFANGHEEEQCLDKGTLSYFDCPSTEETHTGWFGRAGVAAIAYDVEADVTVQSGGLAGPAPYLGGEINEDITLILDIGYQFTDDFSLTFTFGSPFVSVVYATDTPGGGTGGALDGVNLGSAQLGALILGGQYWLPEFYGFRPYIGAGVVYSVILDEEDFALQGIEMDNSWGASAQIGVERMMSDTVGFYFDLRKLYLSNDVTAFSPALGSQLDIELRTDPLVGSTGFVFRF